MVMAIVNNKLPKQAQMKCMHDAGDTSQPGKPVTVFGDIVEKLCCHPAYRLLSLKSLPQMPPSSIDFTTFTWPAILRRLRQMQITGWPSPAAAAVVVVAVAAVNAAAVAVFVAAAAVTAVIAVAADFCATISTKLQIVLTAFCHTMFDHAPRVALTTLKGKKKSAVGWLYSVALLTASLLALRNTRCMGAGSVVEEGLQWDVKVNSSDDIRAQRVNKSLAAMLTLRSDLHWHVAANIMPPACTFSCQAVILTRHVILLEQCTTIAELSTSMSQNPSPICTQVCYRLCAP